MTLSSIPWDLHPHPIPAPAGADPDPDLRTGFLVRRGGPLFASENGKCGSRSDTESWLVLAVLFRHQGALLNSWQKAENTQEGELI